MEKKYELTDETKVITGEDGQEHTLHRIRALQDFDDVRAGDLGVHAGDFGGWVESEKNLSQEGDCWVADEAIVYGNAHVWGEAEVYDNARVYDAAQVYDYAEVSDKAQIYDKAQVHGTARVYGYAEVFGCAQVYDDAVVRDDAWIGGTAQVCGIDEVYDNAQVFGDAALTSGEFTEGEIFCTPEKQEEKVQTQEHKAPAKHH